MSEQRLGWTSVIQQYKQLFAKVFQTVKSDKFAFYTVIFAVIFYVVFFSLFSILRHETFMTQAFDAGIEDQTAWLLSRFLTPFVTVRGLNAFGDSVTLYHFFVASFLWLWDSINILFVLQSLLLGLGAIPLFIFAQRRLGNNFLAVAVALTYLLYPALQNMNLEQYHPEAMSVFFLIVTLFFLLQNEYGLFYLFFVLSFIAKDEIALTGLFIGLFILFVRKSLKHGLIVIGISFVWYLLCSRIFMPYFNGVGIFAPQPLTYSHWFRGLMQNLFNLHYYVDHALHFDSLVYYFHLFVPTAFIALFGMPVLFLVIPSIATNVLSGVIYLRSVFYHYNYVQTAVLFFALIYGLKYLVGKTYAIRLINRYKAVVFGTIIIIFSIGSNVTLSNFPINRQLAMLQEEYGRLNSKSVAVKRKAVSLVPKQAKVSASYSLVPHLTHRREIYMFPNPFKAVLWGQWFQEGRGIPPAQGHVDYLVVDLNNLGVDDQLILDFLLDESYFTRLYQQCTIIVAEKTTKWEGYDYSRERFFHGMTEYKQAKREAKQRFQGGKNLLLNPGFEVNYGLLPKDWEITKWQAEDAKIYLMVGKSERHQGKQSAKLEHQGQADSRWIQVVDVKPHTLYELSGWIKTENIARHGAGAFLQIDDASIKTEELFGTNDWQYVSICYKTGFDQEEMQVLCRLGNYGAPNSGLAYFDQVELRELE